LKICTSPRELLRGGWKINQPKISPLSNYRLEGFSVERLMNFLTARDRDVDIVIRRKSKFGKDGPDSGNSRVASSSAKGERSLSISPSARILLSCLLARGN